MFYNLNKKLIKFLINFLRFIQVSLVFLALFTVLYWVFSLAGAQFVEFFTPFFESIQEFIHIFYTRKVVIDDVSIDFSFLLATILMLVISLAMKYLVEQVEFLEKKLDKAHRYLKGKNEEVFNKILENEYLHEENKNNKLIMFVKVSIIDMAKDKFFTKVEEDNSEEKEKALLTELLENFQKECSCKKTALGSGLILFFDNFKDIDKIIYAMNNCLKDLKLKYKSKNWKINYKIATEVYANEKEIISKIKDLNLLINLCLEDKFICLSTVKQRYALIKTPLYMIESYGIYKINESEEVFYFKKKI